MKRKYKDNIIEAVKKAMAEGYKTSSIIDIIEKKFKVKITSSAMQSIRSGESYHDVSPHLNEKRNTIKHWKQFSQHS
jgi:transposase